MKKRESQKPERLENLRSDVLIDKLALSTTRYTRLLISAPHSDEFEYTKDLILSIQDELTRRSFKSGDPSGNGPNRA